MTTTPNLRTAQVTEARSAANLLQATPVPSRSVWNALKIRAVSMESAESLKFSDGSVLRYLPQAGGYAVS